MENDTTEGTQESTDEAQAVEQEVVAAVEVKTDKRRTKVVATPDAPWGLKADGTPAKRRGRKSKLPQS